MRFNKRDAKFKIQKARSDLIAMHPFFGTLALRLKLKETDQVPVMGTEGVHLYYNPSYVRDMPQVMVLGVIAHEVLHCVFQHMYRRRSRDRMKWNMAADYVINQILIDQRFSLPESRLLDSKYKDMHAEKVYDLLPEPDKQAGEGGGDGEGDSDGQGGWDFGSCIDPDLPDKQGNRPSASEVESQAKGWEMATKQAALIAKKAGKLPGNFESLIDELLAPQIPWRQQLWQFLNQRKPDRITWNKPNRRFIGSGIYLPSRKFVPTGDIVVAVDTSGSISEAELQVFASEINEIHKTIQPKKLWVLDIDTQVHNAEEYGPYDEIKLTYYGRGGTEFDPAFAWLEEKGIRPDALVYLTDGYPCGWPDEMLEYPVLWAITNDTVEPPWGQCLRLLDIDA